MRVIGTAGHVDHGKSTLVQALTGIHPDRLKEEREREMTIDLGFAFLTLPDGEEVGIVDVPGHRDFIENMLSGVGGIDAALFVVAADEGVMPQTREHLAILDLLKVQGGIVALTKIDMVDDPEWLDLVEEELRSTFSETVLQDAPILRVSARDSVGIQELLDSLTELLAGKPKRVNYGRPRLPVDRVFTIAGFGTVVTGTLTDGALSVGEEVEILPSGLSGRIRGLQSHNRKEETALPGSRTAVNISGIAHDAVARGNWVVHPGTYITTRRLDLRFEMLSDVTLPFKHNSEVKFYIGSAEVMGRARVLGAEAFHPGDVGWLQIELVSPVLARRGDRYIIRRPSPGETIGGGEVVDPQPEKRHRRFSKRVLKRLDAIVGGSAADILIETAAGLGLAQMKEISNASALDIETINHELKKLIQQGVFIQFGQEAIKAESQTLIALKSNWLEMQNRMVQAVAAFHIKYPLRWGMPREELRSRLKLSPQVFNGAISRLIADQFLVEQGALLANADHQVVFTEDQKSKIDSTIKLFNDKPVAPPSAKEVITDIGEELFMSLVERGVFIQVSSDVVFLKETFEEMVLSLKGMIREEDGVTVAAFRDRYGTSRKYALAFLEFLDMSGVTIRREDKRYLR